MVLKLTVDSTAIRNPLTFYNGVSPVFSVLVIKGYNGYVGTDGVGFERARINSTGWFKKLFHIALAGSDTVATMKSTGGMKVNYDCEYGKDRYCLFGHKGLLTSIFLNKMQIGFIKEEAKSGKGKINFEIVLNSNVDLTLVCCIVGVFIKTTVSYNAEQANVNYNWGNIGPEEFKFDESWEPA